MTLNGVMAIILRYFTEFVIPAFQRITASARKKESSRSLSYLLMSFLVSCPSLFRTIVTAQVLSVGETEEVPSGQ